MPATLSLLGSILTLRLGTLHMVMVLVSSDAKREIYLGPKNSDQMTTISWNMQPNLRQALCRQSLLCKVQSLRCGVSHGPLTCAYPSYPPNLMLKYHWLVGSTYPSENWWSESQLGWWHSQLNGQSYNSMVPNHQSDHFPTQIVFYWGYAPFPDTPIWA